MKAQSKLIALPDAVANYNGKNGNFMIHNRAMFVPEGIALDEIKRQSKTYLIYMFCILDDSFAIILFLNSKNTKSIYRYKA